MEFGIYKGKSLKDIADFDFQYILWCNKNIINFYDKLNNEDKNTIRYIFNPFYEIDINSISCDELIALLRQRGVIRSYSNYESSDNDYVIKLDTIYGICHHYEHADNIFYDPKSIIVERINRWVKKINNESNQ